MTVQYISAERNEKCWCSTELVLHLLSQFSGRRCRGGETKRAMKSSLHGSGYCWFVMWHTICGFARFKITNCIIFHGSVNHMWFACAIGKGDIEVRDQRLIKLLSDLILLLAK